MDASSLEERVLVLAPIGRDASIAVTVLREGGIASEACRDIETLCGLLTEGTGAALLTEEALSPAATHRLVEVLGMQPPWSDLPLVVYDLQRAPPEHAFICRSGKCAR